MSANDFQGKYHAIRTFMQSVQQDIDQERRKGADRRFRDAAPQVRMSWREQLLQRVNNVRRSA